MIEPPAHEPTADELADWAELQVLFGSRESLPFAEAMRLFADRWGDDAPDDADLEDDLLEEEAGDSDYDDAVYLDESREAAAEGMTAGEQRWERLLGAIAFREQVVGSAYPFAADEDSLLLARSWADDPLYAFLALVSARLAYSLGAKLPVHRPARLFEQVVAIALGRYVGGEGHRFGWPRLQDEPVEEFPMKVRRLARRMGEHPGAMRNVGPDDKDHKLDVIAWRGLGDSTIDEPTPGQAIIVCQCGIGEDWNSKVLVPRMWEKIIDFAVPPTGALAFPIAPSRDDEHLHIWHDIASAGSIPFDRLRIASLVRTEDLTDALKADLVSWIRDSVTALPSTTP